MAKSGFVGKLLAGAALALIAVSASAQDVRDLDSEQSNVRSFSGVVGREAAVFEVSVPAATSLRIDAITSGELDPTLKVTDAATGEVLGEDDDSGGDLNPRLTVRGQDGRRIRIEVSRFSYDGMEDGEMVGGAFDLRLTTLVYNPQSLRNVTWGSVLGGTLLGEDKHEFAFTGEEGALLEVALQSAEEGGLDPYLELRDESGDVVASNDDSGGGLNSLLRHVMQSGGTYTIVASDYGDTGGDYTLRVAEKRELVVQAPLQVIGIDDRAQGRLGSGYENGDIDPEMIEYQLSEEAIASIMAGDGEVTIRMNALADAEGDEFTGNIDPLIELGFATPLGFASVDSDDDSGGELNAMLPIDLSSMARDRDLLSRLRIRAKTVSNGGGYTLRITEGMEVRRAYDEELSVSAPIPMTVPPPPPMQSSPIRPMVRDRTGT